MNKKARRNTMICYLVLNIVALIMLYPLFWLFFATFKENNEIFNTVSLVPEKWSLQGYINGWKGTGQYTFGTYFSNTFKLVLPSVIFTVLSCAIVGFGFARFKFVGKKVFFALMIATMMLPNSVMLIPRYLMFRDLKWLDTYLPFIVPSMFAGSAFFIFMFIQFFRGIPKELDESAYVDGCSSVMLLWKIILPLSKPAIFSAMIFQFMWSWNDFFGPLIYINSVKKFTLAQGLRMSMDVNASIAWNNILAMALVSVLPLILLFFFAQKYFVEGIATTGIKG